MRFMSQRQATYLSKLRKLADGDIDLLDNAIAYAYDLAKKRHDPHPAPKLGDIVEYIKKNKHNSAA
jgi:hypothetical protein